MLFFTIQGDEAWPAGRRHDASPAQAAEQVSDDDDNNHEPRQHRDGQLPEALASLADQVGHGDPQETVHVVLPRDDQAQYNFVHVSRRANFTLYIVSNRCTLLISDFKLYCEPVSRGTVSVDVKPPHERRGGGYVGEAAIGIVLRGVLVDGQLTSTDAKELGSVT